MKKVLFTVILATSLAQASHAAVSFGGTALLNAPSLAAGDVGVLLNDDNGVGFAVLAGNIQAGLSLTDNSTYSGSWGSFSVLGSNTAASVFGSIALAGGATFSLTGGIASGDNFGYAIFSGSTTTTIAGDPVSIWTAPNWVIPADGATLTWPANFTQITSSSTGALETAVVPEPSTYALLALGGLAVAGHVLRRRRRAV